MDAKATQMAQTGSALAEGLYWMAEKLAWGYDDVQPNLSEAFKLFKQSADLGFSDALTVEPWTLACIKA
jgi:TPR repeat protein